MATIEGIKTVGDLKRALTLIAHDDDKISILVEDQPLFGWTEAKVEVREDTSPDASWSGHRARIIGV